MVENIILPANKYVVAVSGGVDSVVLLDILTKQQDLQLVVAHFDHGIRPNSAEDAKFVEQLAQKYGLVFETERVELGPDASEELARAKRYNFLRRVIKKHSAKAIITAHHQDDVIETGMINILRGTGRHGLTSLRTQEDIVRPLLHVPKSDILAYAKNHDLTWREDSTNLDTKYLRNNIRHNVVSKMSVPQKQQWIEIVDKMYKINEKLDIEIQNLLRRGLHKNQLVLSRGWFIMLPHAIAKEVIIVLLQRVGAKEIDRKTVERLTVQIKTIKAGKTLQASGVEINLTKRSARFINKVNLEVGKRR